MTEGFNTHHNVSVVTAILPQHVANDAIEAVFQAGETNCMLVNARGTLMRDRWYQALIPMVSPEKEYLQFLVPDREVDRVIESLVGSANLHLPGAGAVFAVPCDELACTDNFHIWTDAAWETDTFNASAGLRENLTAIFCIVSTDQTDQVSRAAMNAGAHGPVIYYCEGRGLRDRLGWLRITKRNEKEVLVVIVDNSDAVAVTEAMVDAGDLDLPGRGFLYRMPVQKGVINIGSTFGRNKYAANMQQVIAAIDQLSGSTQWRDQRVNELVGTGKAAGLGLFGKVKARAYLTGQSILTCLVGRKHCDAVVRAALEGGAPGATVNYAKLIAADSEATTRGVRLNRERGIVRTVLPEDRLTNVVLHIQAECVEHEVDEVCLYSQPVTRAITYIADEAHRPDVVIGGRAHPRPPGGR